MSIQEELALASENHFHMTHLCRLPCNHSCIFLLMCAHMPVQSCHLWYQYKNLDVNTHIVLCTIWIYVVSSPSLVGVRICSAKMALIHDINHSRQSKQ